MAISVVQQHAASGKCSGLGHGDIGLTSEMSRISLLDHQATHIKGGEITHLNNLGKTIDFEPWLNDNQAQDACRRETKRVS